MARPKPWWIGWRMVALVILAVHVVGTLGYVLIEGWSAWDAFYMTVITVTTVGYGEVHPMSQAGRAFTVFVLLTGVGAFFSAFTIFMAIGTFNHLDRFMTSHVAFWIWVGLYVTTPVLVPLAW